MARGDGRPRDVSWHAEAVRDRERLKADEPKVWDQTRLYLRLVERGEYEGDLLADAARTGDLSDCRKVYVGDGTMPPSHRLVYREAAEDDVSPAEVQVVAVEVVAIVEREDAHAYMQAARRLGRLPKETEGEAKRVHDKIVRERAAKRRGKKGLDGG